MVTFRIRKARFVAGEDQGDVLHDLAEQRDPLPLQAGEGFISRKVRYQEGAVDAHEGPGMQSVVSLPADKVPCHKNKVNRRARLGNLELFHSDLGADGGGVGVL